MSASSVDDHGSVAPTMKDILSDADLAMVFRDYLHQLHSAENLSFHVEVEEYKSKEDIDERKATADKIWSKYLASNAPAALNIDSKTRDRISAGITASTIDLFDEAQEFAYSLLEYDSYRKFVASDTYSRWLSTF